MKASHCIKAVYSVEIELPEPVNEVFSRALDLAQWWPEEYEGEPIKPGTEFILKTGEDHFSKNKVVEFIPNKKLAWQTTESLRKSDGYDWTGTKFIFDLAPKGNNTIFKFTYDGIVPENEKERLAQVCDTCIKDLFYSFVTGESKKDQGSDEVNESFTAILEVPNSAREIFQRITTDVAKWWGGKDFSGKSTGLGDEFTIHHPGAHFSKQRLIEVVSDQKVVWLVTESYLSWLKNPEEWTSTKMIFKITAKQDSSLLHFTHEGLVPVKESYSRCSEGWNSVIRDWLYTLITSGKQHFEE